jgi:hypothetical protein
MLEKNSGGKQVNLQVESKAGLSLKNGMWLY